MKLNEAREHLDKIDKQISKLLNKRFQIMKEIKEIKEKNQLPVENLNREKVVLENNKQYVSPSFHSEFSEVYQTIIKVSKDIQKR